jgi:hypothetical protein
LAVAVLLLLGLLPMATPALTPFLTLQLLAHTRDVLLLLGVVMVDTDTLCLLTVAPVVLAAGVATVYLVLLTVALEFLVKVTLTVGALT